MRGPVDVPLDRFLVEAAKRDMVRVSSPALGRAAGVRQQLAWDWAHGRTVNEETARRLRRALGLGEAPESRR